MSEQVKVDDLEVFRRFRAAMLKFSQSASQALSSADGEITRMHGWLATEQTAYWQGQFKKRTEAVAAAREAVRAKKMFKDPSGKPYSSIEEEKALSRCLVAVEEAQRKLLAIRKAIPKLEDEAQLYRGGVTRLWGDTSDDIPKAVALLDRLATRLEEYIQMQAPVSAGDVGGSGVESSFARGTDTLPPAAAGEAPVTAPDAEAAAGSAPEVMPEASVETPFEPAPRKEGEDVADGK